VAATALAWAGAAPSWRFSLLLILRPGCGLCSLGPRHQSLFRALGEPLLPNSPALPSPSPQTHHHLPIRDHTGSPAPAGAALGPTVGPTNPLPSAPGTQLRVLLAETLTPHSLQLL